MLLLLVLSCRAVGVVLGGGIFVDVDGAIACVDKVESVPPFTFFA